jgi:predicted ATPase
MAQEIWRLAETLQEPPYVLTAHRAFAVERFWRGEFTEAQTNFEKVMAIYDPQQHHTMAFLHWIDPGIHTLSFMALNLWLLGFTDQALRKSHEALALAHELSHSYSLAFALFFAAWLQFFRRDFYATQDRAEKTVDLSTEQRFPIWAAGGDIFLNWALAMQGRGETHVSQICQSMSTMRETGMEQLQQFWRAVLAELKVKAGQPEVGLHALAEAETVMRRTGERFWKAELYRLKGKLLLSHSAENQSEAKACFHQALEVARRQSAKSLELRAVMSLSRLWQKQGKQEKARQMLAEIYGWFTEGFDTTDLKEAKTLLEELS